MIPTRRTVRLALAGLLPALLPTLVDGRLWPLWVVTLFWLLLLCGLDALSLPRPARVAVEADLPESVEVGTRLEARFELERLGPFVRRVEGRLAGDEVLGEIEPAEATVEQGRARLTFPIQTRRRGEARVGPLALRAQGRLGLMARQWTVDPAAGVTVVPDIRPVRVAALRTAFADAREGMRVERFRGDGSEFDSLREFVEGDDARRIDWRHSARHRRLVTRQHRAERNSQVVLAIDTGRLMSEAVTGVSKLDHAIGAALLLSYVCLKTGDRVGMFSFDSRAGVYLGPRAGMRTQHVLARTAAGLRYGEDETNFTLGLTTLAQRLRRRSMVVVLTDFIDTVTAELMIENVTRLARRHLIVFVALQDPRLAAVGEADPRTVLRLNRAVVATRLRREREVVMLRLRDAGVLCIDARPDEISARTIDAYLEIKRRERI